MISPEDTLAVYVYDVPELSRDYLVNSGGTIVVPLLNTPVRAAGLSLTEFAHNLEKSFRESGVLSNPRVSVDVRQSRRSVVTVEGAVKNPQAVPVFGRTTLRAVLDQCGGIAEDAGNTITVTRGAAGTGGFGDGGPATAVVFVDVKKLKDTNDPMSRFEVWPGDRVSVEHAGMFYVLGEVNRPGGYNLKTAQEQVTVLEALAIAGDLTSVAKKDKAKIIRKDPKAPGGLLEVALNVKAIIAGHLPDQVLQTNDILYVPGSGPKKLGRTFTQSAVSIVSGAGALAVYGR
jgi:polysaccharide export outer membrane protein